MRAVSLPKDKHASAINRDNVVMAQQTLLVPDSLADQAFDRATDDGLHLYDLDPFAPFIQTVTMWTPGHTKQFQELLCRGRVVTQLLSDLAACAQMTTEHQHAHKGQQWLRINYMRGIAWVVDCGKQLLDATEKVLDRFEKTVYQLRLRLGIVRTLSFKVGFVHTRTITPFASQCQSCSAKNSLGCWRKHPLFTAAAQTIAFILQSCAVVEPGSMSFL